ncbi:MAG: YggS family pyridoxal phosphate-dependent enzyme [Clostridia bacterium]|nr:YggS family pyridoxal phosphate-dependent enzyme [Clostridia bacterium]
MSQISENLEGIRAKIAKAAEKSGRDPKEITLVAVTKTYSPEAINEAIDCGVTDIGENKVQEIMEKYDKVKPVRWHLIGHLQTNKVKYIIDKVWMIHSVDSVHLMDEIDRQAQKHGVVMKILIQVNISGEESKFGISPDEIDEMLNHAEQLKNVKVCGLMTIMPIVDSNISNRLHFVNIKRIYIDISKKKYNNITMDYLSMGMSGDFEMAIEEGSNMVRIGRAIFGERNYN